MQRLQGLQRIEIELLLRLANIRVALLDDREVHVFLVAEVVVEHALGAARLGGNAFQPRSVIAVIGKLGLARVQQGSAHIGRCLVCRRLLAQ